MNNAANQSTNEAQSQPRGEVLVLEHLSFRDATRQSLTLRDANLTLREGQLVTLRVAPSVECRSFASMLQGLRMPQQGRVLFDGQDWLGDDYAKLDQMRSRIGRVFDGTAWIENLNIHENVTLRQRHHTRRTIDEIDAEVRYWSERFDIEDMSNQRPAFVGKTFLRICEWIRALIGSPRLLLLERPLRSVPATRLPSLIEAVVSATDRGAAVFWIAREGEIDEQAFPADTSHLRVVDSQFVPVG